MAKQAKEAIAKTLEIALYQTSKKKPGIYHKDDNFMGDVIKDDILDNLVEGIKVICDSERANRAQTGKQSSAFSPGQPWRFEVKLDGERVLSYNAEDENILQRKLRYFKEQKDTNHLKNPVKMAEIVKRPLVEGSKPTVTPFIGLKVTASK